MSTHERLTGLEHPRGSSDRSFGFVFTVVFLIVGVWPLLRGNPVRVWALVVAAVFAAAALLIPRVLHPLNVAWGRVGLVLAKVVNPVVTAVMYFVVLTPFALLWRALGKDPLRLRSDAEAASYWIERKPPGPTPESMANQF